MQFGNVVGNVAETAKHTYALHTRMHTHNTQNTHNVKHTHTNPYETQTDTRQVCSPIYGAAERAPGACMASTFCSALRARSCAAGCGDNDTTDISARGPLRARKCLWDDSVVGEGEREWRTETKAGTIAHHSLGGDVISRHPSPTATTDTATV